MARQLIVAIAESVHSEKPLKTSRTASQKERCKS